MVLRVNERRKELLHVAQARRPVNQCAHRSSVASHVGFGVDYVRRIEMEGLYDIEPALARSERSACGREYVGRSPRTWYSD